MDLIKGDIKTIFRKYFFTALGSSLIISIYSIVDMICVGQYAGPAGAAALGVVLPTWSVILSLGMLVGIGGSVLYGVAKGAGDRHRANACFTSAVIFAGIIAAVVTVLFVVQKESIMRFFGADDNILPYTIAYLDGIIPAFPAFALEQMLFMFVRSDENPVIPTLSVLIGGGFNIFADIYFVFGLDMGVAGAGLATGISEYVAMAVCMIHFFGRGNTLRFAFEGNPFRTMGQILKTGFAPFVIDVSYGILVIVFNNQIMAYAGETELAVFGCVSNITILAICIFYSVADSCQPLASVNYGAGEYARTRKILLRSVRAAALIGIIAFAFVMIFPDFILRAFMDVNSDVMAVGPGILRVYSLSYLLTGVNITICYYFQAVLRTGRSVFLSILRGFVLSIALLYILPAAFGFDSIWLAMTITEIIILVLAIVFLKRDSLGKEVK